MYPRKRKATNVAVNSQPGPSFQGADTPDSSLHEEERGEGETPTAPCTPTRRAKKSTPSNENVCRKCGIAFDSRMDVEYDSRWINCCQRSCTYWVHLFCLGIEVEESKIPTFEKSVKYFCVKHNPHALPREKSLVSKRL